jgi:hypothetical protein
MEGLGQLQVPAALLMGKELRYALNSKLVGSWRKLRLMVGYRYFEVCTQVIYNTLYIVQCVI